jgi:hypothetical protein
LGEVLEALPVHEELVDDTLVGADGEGHANVGGAELEVDHGFDVRELLWWGRRGGKLWVGCEWRRERAGFLRVCIP